MARIGKRLVPRGSASGLCGLALVLVQGCGGSSSLAPVEGIGIASGPTGAPVANASSLHVVSQGDTLYSIAWRYGLDYRDVAAWNDIRQPFTIYPGQHLTLARGDAPASARPLSPGAGPAITRPLPEPDPGSGKTDAPESVRPAPASNEAATPRKVVRSAPPKRVAPAGATVGDVRWFRPTDANVITSFRGTGEKGVNFGGTLGDPVLAASDGRVVYSGGGLIGYGKLIIVKHNDRFLSAYAHNNKILVREGDTVKGGQRIAEMGRTGAERVMLHFEIRRDGKPVNPMRYLPKHR